MPGSALHASFNLNINFVMSIEICFSKIKYSLYNTYLSTRTSALGSRINGGGGGNNKRGAWNIK